MPVKYIPFGSVEGDRGITAEGGLIYAINAIKTGDGYVPVYQPQAAAEAKSYTIASANAILGLHAIPSVSSTPNFVLGTKTQLLSGTAGANMTDVTRAGGGTPYNASSTAQWRFCAFGNSKTLATQKNDDIQTWNNNTGSDFAKNNVIVTPTSADPRAAYICSFKQHVVIGNFTLAHTGGAFGALSNIDYPDGIWISATDDETRFGSPVDTPTLINTDYKILRDEYGKVTGLIGGDAVTIFKERAIYLLEGPPYTYRPIVRGTGCIFPNSIVEFFGDIYFWGESGPAILKANSAEVQPLGLGRWTKYISRGTNFAGLVVPDSSVGVYDISAAIDCRYGIVYWSYPCANFDSGNYVILAYNINDDAISFLSSRILTTAEGSNAGTGGVKLATAPFPPTTQGHPSLRVVNTQLTSDATNNYFYLASPLPKSGGANTEAWKLPIVFETGAWRPSDVGDEANYRIKRVKLILTTNPDYSSIQNHSGGLGSLTGTLQISSKNSVEAYSTPVTFNYTAGNTVDNWIQPDNDVFSKYKVINISISGPATEDLYKINTISGLLIEYEIGGIF